MEGKGDDANPPHQPTPNFHLKRKFPSDDDCKGFCEIPELRVEVGWQDESKSFDGPTRLKHKLAKDAEQLKQLRASCSENQNQNPNPNQEKFLDKMLASYEEAIAILNKIASEEQDQGQGDLVSPRPRPPDDSDNCSMAASSCMVPSQKISKVKPMHYERDISKVTWKVICQGQNGDAQDDGYTWRKYGQRDILGAKHPRCYYRCTHRNVHGCLATKQVQWSDDDPTIVEVVYHGRHTCKKSPVDASNTSQELSETSNTYQKSSQASNTCWKAAVEEVTDVLDIPDVSSPLMELEIPDVSSPLLE